MILYSIYTYNRSGKLPIDEVKDKIEETIDDVRGMDTKKIEKKLEKSIDEVEKMIKKKKD